MILVMVAGNLVLILGIFLLFVAGYRCCWRVSVNSKQEWFDVGLPFWPGFFLFIFGSIYHVARGFTVELVVALAIALTLCALLVVLVRRRHFTVAAWRRRKTPGMEGTAPFGVPLYVRKAKDPYHRLVQVLNRQGGVQNKQGGTRHEDDW